MKIRFNKLVFFSVLILFGCDKTIEKNIVESKEKSNIEIISQINKKTWMNPSASGRVEYFVCDDGSDANDGETPYSPWQTFEKAMVEFNHLNEGESIRFCRGGVFYVEKSIKLFNKNCTSDLPCMISDYYPPNQISNSRPVIQSLEGLTVFPFQDGGVADQDGGYILKNLVLESNVLKKVAIFLHNDVDDLIIDNIKIDGFTGGIFSAGAGKLSIGSNGINERIVLKNSQIINNSGQGWQGGCSDCVIDSNIFENNGYKGRLLYHNIYFSGKKSGNKNIIISNNKLTKSAIVDGKCSGASIVVHGIIDGIRIDNNLIEEKLDAANQGCWGISLDPGWSTEEKFENVIIKGNTLINVGNVAIGCASCVNVLIEGNIILHEQAFGFSGIKVPVKKEDSVKSSNITIKNNTINITNIKGRKKAGIKTSGQEMNVILQDNKFFSNRGSDNCIIFDGENLDDILSCQPY